MTGRAIHKPNENLSEPRAGLRAALPPELVAAVDWRTLRVEKGSFVDEALRSRYSDLVLSASLRGRRMYFYVLIEHQRKVEALMVFRMGLYVMRLWERLVRDFPTRKELPPILPVLLHHSDTGWTAATAFQDIVPVEPALRAALSPHIPHFELLLIDISEGQASRLADAALTPLARAALKLLSLAGDSEHLEPEIFALGEVLEEIVQAPNGHAALQALMRYVVATQRRYDVTKVRKLFEQAGGPRTKEAIVTVLDEFDRWFERRGERRGRREGLRIGEQKGRAELLQHLITARFGSVPPEVAARIKAADARLLDRWALRVLSATTPEAVVADADAEAAQPKPSPRRPATRRRAGKPAASKRRA